MHENWLEERGEQFRSGIQIATLDPLPRTARTPLTTSSKTRPACSTHFISSSSLATPHVRCVAASSKTRPDTADAQAIPSTKSDFSCAPRAAGSTHVNKNASVWPSRQMRHTSVSKSPTFTGQVREVFHQATPTQGQRLAAHLIQRLPACPIPEIARLGRTLRKWKDALDAYFDTAGASNAPHRSHQRNHRTRQTHRQRLPQPHQLPTPNAPHRRRLRRLPPHPTMKSPHHPSTPQRRRIQAPTSPQIMKSQ